MFFLAKGDKKHLSERDRVLVKLMFQRGYSVAQIQEAVQTHFDYFVSLDVLYKVQRNFSLQEVDQQLVRDVEAVLIELEHVLKFTALDEIEKTRRMRLTVDSRIMEQVESPKPLAVKDLSQLSKQLFEREQLLAGRPTAITQTYKGMSDEQLVEELKKINVISISAKDSTQTEGGGQENPSGTQPTQDGGENPVLEAAPTAE